MKWHETLLANMGLRSGGLLLIVSGWSVAVHLRQLALSAAGRDATPIMMAMSAVIFLCGSAGSALLFVGPGLWQPAEVSERWRPIPASATEPAQDGGSDFALPSAAVETPEADEESNMRAAVGPSRLPMG